MFAPDWLNTKLDYYRIQSNHKSCAAYTLIYPRQNENKQLKEFIWLPKRNRVRISPSLSVCVCKQLCRKNKQPRGTYIWMRKQTEAVIVS